MKDLPALQARPSRLITARPFIRIVACPVLSLRRFRVSIAESQPICTSTVTNGTVAVGDAITFACEVAYRGKWAPQMVWTSRAAAGPIDSLQSSTPGGIVRSSISITVDETDEPIEFSCITNFSNILIPAPDAENHEATNIPGYEYRYSSGEIIVQCKYRK